ncbi:MAG: hypothetical protein R2860_11120 [Desulfobacterales bacterium]
MEFASAIVTKGTTTVVRRPHEIANVMGTAGIICWQPAKICR